MTDNAVIQPAQIDAFPEQATMITESLAEAQTVIAEALAALHQENNPEQRREIAAVTYEWCEYITALANDQRALTGAAAAMANKALEQRDEAIRALEELAAAVDDIDTDNPRVRGLVEAVEEGVAEWAYEDAYETVSESLYDDMVSNLRLRLGLDWTQADELIGALREGSSAAVTDARLDQLITYLQALRDERRQ